MTLQDIIADIHALTEDLEVFERKYGVLSETFYELYQRGVEPDNDAWVFDWADWAGAYDIFLERQQQYRRTIQALQRPFLWNLRDLLAAGGLMNRLAKRPRCQRAIEILLKPLLGKLDIFFFFFAPHGAAIAHDGGEKRRADASIRIKDPIIFIRQRQDAPLDKFYRKLARMRGFFRVIRFDVRNIPQRGFPIAR